MRAKTMRQGRSCTGSNSFHLPRTRLMPPSIGTRGLVSAWTKRSTGSKKTRQMSDPNVALGLEEGSASTFMVVVKTI